MKKQGKKIIYVVLLCLLFTTACHGNSAQGENASSVKNTESENVSSVTNTGSENSLQPTREYFENVNRDYTMDDVVSEIGNADGTEGSGVIHYYWNIEDDGQAYVTFSSPNLLIERITISYPDQEYELIFQREY